MIVEITLALALGLVVATVLAVLATRKVRPNQTTASAFLFFFLIAFFFIWAAGSMASPWGFTVLAVDWGPFLFWALVIGLILAVISIPSEADLQTDADLEMDPERSRMEKDPVGVSMAIGAFSVLFFVLLFVLSLAAVTYAVT